MSWDCDHASANMENGSPLVGTELFMGDETTTYAAIVQSRGEAYRLSEQILKEE
jgi:hypothetical protein